MLIPVDPLSARPLLLPCPSRVHFSHRQPLPTMSGYSPMSEMQSQNIYTPDFIDT